MSNSKSLSRRSFLKGIGAGAVGVAAAGAFAGDGPPVGAVEQRDLGKTGIKVSEINFGGYALGDRNTNVLRMALERGITYIDTGESYGQGASEAAIGEAVEAFGRDKVVIQTKVSANLRNGFEMSDEEVEQNLRSSVEECLKRLRTDYIDVLMHPHGAKDPKTIDYPQLRKAVEKLKADGVIRAFGVSTHTNYAECFKAALDSGWHDVVMPGISMANLVEDLIPLAREELKKINEEKLAKIEDEKQRARQLRRQREIYDLRGLTSRAKEQNIGLVCMKGVGFSKMCGPEFEAAARERFASGDNSMSFHRICYRYMLERPEFASVSVGMSTMKHLEEAVALIAARAVKA